MKSPTFFGVGRGHWDSMQISLKGVVHLDWVGVGAPEAQSKWTSQNRLASCEMVNDGQ